MADNAPEKKGLTMGRMQPSGGKRKFNNLAENSTTSKLIVDNGLKKKKSVATEKMQQTGSKNKTTNRSRDSCPMKHVHRVLDKTPKDDKLEGRAGPVISSAIGKMESRFGGTPSLKMMPLTSPAPTPGPKNPQGVLIKKPTHHTKYLVRKLREAFEIDDEDCINISKINAGTSTPIPPSPSPNILSSSPITSDIGMTMRPSLSFGANASCPLLSGHYLPDLAGQEPVNKLEQLNGSTVDQERPLYLTGTAIPEVLPTPNHELLAGESSNTQDFVALRPDSKQSHSVNSEFLENGASVLLAPTSTKGEFLPSPPTCQYTSTTPKVLCLTPSLLQTLDKLVEQPSASPGHPSLQEHNYHPPLSTFHHGTMPRSGFSDHDAPSNSTCFLGIHSSDTGTVYSTGPGPVALTVQVDNVSYLAQRTTSPPPSPDIQIQPSSTSESSAGITPHYVRLEKSTFTSPNLATWARSPQDDQIQTCQTYYRLPGYHFTQTRTQACDIRDRLIEEAVEYDEAAEFYYERACYYRARAEEGRRRIADLDRILGPGPFCTPEVDM